MPVSGVPIVITTIQHLTAKDLRNPDIESRVNDFNMQLEQRLDDTNFLLPRNDIDYYYPTDKYEVEHENGDNKDGDPQEG